MAYLSAGEDTGDPLNGMQCFRLAHYMFSPDDYNCNELSLLILQAKILDIEE